MRLKACKARKKNIKRKRGLRERKITGEGTDKNDVRARANEIDGERRNKLEGPKSQKKMC